MSKQKTGPHKTVAIDHSVLVDALGELEEYFRYESRGYTCPSCRGSLGPDRKKGEILHAPKCRLARVLAAIKAALGEEPPHHATLAPSVRPRR